MSLETIELAESIAKDFKRHRHLDADEVKTIIILLKLREHTAAIGVVPKKLPYPRANIRQRRQLDQRPQEAMTPEERQLDGWLRTRLGKRARRGWSAAEVLDAMMDLGYENLPGDFLADVHRFAVELSRFKRKHHIKVWIWTAVLLVARRLGWRRAESGKAKHHV